MHVRNVLAISVVVAAIGAGTVTAPAAVAATASSAVTAIDSFHNPDGVAISPDGKTAYVADSGAVASASGAAEYGLFLVAVATNTITKTIVSPSFDAPVAVAVNPSGAYVYVLNSTGTVSVVSTASDTVTATISAVSSDPGPKAIVISPDGKTGYVSDNGAGVISVLNLAKDAVTTTISVTTPSALVLSPNGTKLYVSTGATGTGVPVIETATNKVTGTLSIGGPSYGLGGLAISSDGSTLYMAEDGNPEEILVASTASLSVTSTIYANAGLGLFAGPGALTLDGTSLYVAASNGMSAQITVVDTAQDAAGATATIAESSVSSLAITPGGVIYAAGPASAQGEVAVIGTDPLQLSGIVPSLGSGPTAVAASPNGKAVYVANYDSDTLTAIDTATGIAVASIPVGREPDAVEVSPDSATVYVANKQDGTVSVVNAAHDAVTATIPVGTSPEAIAISSNGETVYVANYGSDSHSVSVIDPAFIGTATDPVTSTINVFGDPSDLVVSPDGSTIYAATGGSVRVISVASGTTTTIWAAASALALSPDGKTLYAASGDELSVIDVATGVIVKTVATSYVSDQAGGLAISPDGTALYAIGNPGEGTGSVQPGQISVLSTSSDTLATTIPVPGSSTDVSAVAVSPNGILYVADSGNSAVDRVTPPVLQAPKITSRPAATLTVGKKGSFEVATSGYPVATLSESGALPKGVTFKNNKNGTATISGTPAANTGKMYSITLKASNGVGATASGSFRLTVDQAPKITSATRATFTYRKKGSFEVKTSGYPVATLSESGALPKGVTFKNNKNGTATLAGTPAVDANKTYTLTIKASNGVGSAVTVKLQLILKK